jgi:hypothetical protein
MISAKLKIESVGSKKHSIKKRIETKISFGKQKVFNQFALKTKKASFNVTMLFAINLNLKL